MTALLRSTRLTVTEVDRIDGTAWDSVAANASLYSSHAWLKHVEHYGDSVPRYLLVHDDGRLVGALPTYRFGAAMPHFYAPESLLPGAGRVRPVLLGGTRLGYTTEFLLRPGLSDATRASVVGLLLDRLRAEPAGLTALLYLTDASMDLARPHLADGDQVFVLDARARLPVGRSGLTGYLNAAGSHRRTRMRKEIRRFHDAGCRAEVLPLSACHQHLGGLSAQVLQRYGHDVTAEHMANRFATQVTGLDDLCHVIVARHGDRIVGFTQFFGWGEVLYARVHGLDDSMARSASLYYNLTYYQAIEFAATNGYRMIDLGCDSYEAKVRRGARLEPLWGLVLQPGWDESVVERVAHESSRRLESFAAWDPGVR